MNKIVCPACEREITEQALSSILDYLAQQNKPESSNVLNPCSFQENGAGPEGLAPKWGQVQRVKREKRKVLACFAKVHFFSFFS